jgi:hypothetical protein
MVVWFWNIYLTEYGPHEGKRGKDCDDNSNPGQTPEPGRPWKENEGHRDDNHWEEKNIRKNPTKQCYRRRVA